MALLSLVLLTAGAAAQDFCALSPRHTACPADKGPGPSCNGGHLARGVTDREVEVIMETHNRLRALVARGEERRGQPGPQPGAADMRQMTWDPELAVVAQAHADQCKFEHDCSECRKVERFGVGQNLYIYKQSQRKADNDWEKGILSWYDEVALFNRKHVEPFKFSSPTGHYTALAWADTDRVGCGAASYKSGKWFATLYTCNYGPNGNFIRGQMYQSGPACSACPSGLSCSGSFPGLCSSGGNSTGPAPRLAPQANTIPAPPSKTRRPQGPGKDRVKKPILKTITTKAPRRRPTPTTRKTTTTTRRIPTTTRRTTPTTKRTTTTTRRTSTRRTTPEPRRVITSTTIPTTVAKASPLPGGGRLLFSCGFSAPAVGGSCRRRTSGEAWGERADRTNDPYTAASLPEGANTEFFFQQLISPPAGGVACLDFRYQKESSGGPGSRLTVLAWPRRGRPGRVAVAQDSPGTGAWVRAQVTFRKVDQQFVVMFRAEARNGTLRLAVDDVRVTEGACREAGASPRL